MESISDQADDMESLSSESFSCRSLFNNVPFVRERKLAIFLYCQFSDENSRNRSFCPGLHWKGFEELSGRFHMLRITHKYPVLQKVCSGASISNTIVMLVVPSHRLFIIASQMYSSFKVIKLFQTGQAYLPRP